jgi:hypothetical protein
VNTKDPVPAKAPTTAEIIGDSRKSVVPSRDALAKQRVITWRGKPLSSLTDAEVLDAWVLVDKRRREMLYPPVRLVPYTPPADLVAHAVTFGEIMDREMTIRGMVCWV